MRCESMGSGLTASLCLLPTNPFGTCHLFCSYAVVLTLPPTVLEHLVLCTRLFPPWRSGGPHASDSELVEPLPVQKNLRGGRAR